MRKYYLFKTVKENTSATSQSSCFNKQQVDDALSWVNNHITSHSSFSSRPHSMSIRMFDTYTTSNAEAEHSALKCASVGISANDTMTALAQKTNIQATRRTNQRVLDQTKDLQCTDTRSKCPLSNVITKRCFNAISQYVELAKECISKQTSNTSWTVCYQRPTGISTKLHLHYLPLIRRKRFLSIESGMIK